MHALMYILRYLSKKQKLYAGVELGPYQVPGGKKLQRIILRRGQCQY